jgi:hypothetical protein
VLAFDGCRGEYDDRSRWDAEFRPQVRGRTGSKAGHVDEVRDGRPGVSADVLSLDLIVVPRGQVLQVFDGRQETRWLFRAVGENRFGTNQPGSTSPLHEAGHLWVLNVQDVDPLPPQEPQQVERERHLFDVVPGAESEPPTEEPGQSSEQPAGGVRFPRPARHDPFERPVGRAGPFAQQHRHLASVQGRGEVVGPGFDAPGHVPQAACRDGDPNTPIHDILRYKATVRRTMSSSRK